MQRQLDTRGVSLLGVLLASSIASIVIYGMSSMVAVGLKGSKGVSASVDFDIKLSQIHRLINDQATCDNMFRQQIGPAGGFRAKFGYVDNNDPLTGLISTGLTHRLVQSVSAQVIEHLEVGEVIGNLRIDQIYLRYQLDSLSNPIDPVPGPGPGQFTHFVELIVNATRLVGMGSQVKSNTDRPFQLTVVTNASDEIVGCNPGTQARTQCLVQRSQSFSGDAIAWCPATHPNLLDCHQIDNQAPVAGPTDVSTLPPGCDTTGTCPVAGMRGDLGADDVLLERVTQGAPPNVRAGCLAYDKSHSHANYRLETYCCN